MNSNHLFNEALQSGTPRRHLRSLVSDLHAQGQERQSILKELDDFRKELRQSEEDEEDIVLDVLDFVTGWCHPDMLL